MHSIFWSGYSNEERQAAINTIQSTVSKYGHIIDFKFFSDLSITVTIEIEEVKIDFLYNELKEKIRMDNFEYLNSVSTRERVIYLNMTFMKGMGNLKDEVPAVPG